MHYSEYDIEISAAIKIIREYKGIKQMVIAYKLGVDKSTYSRMEKAQIVITPGQLTIITKTLNIGILTFMALVKTIENKSNDCEYYLSIVYEPEFLEPDFINILGLIREYLTKLRNK